MAEAAYMIIDSKFFPWLFCRWKFFWSWSTKARTVPLILNDIWMLKVIANATTNRTWYHCKLHLENKNCPQPQKSWRHHCNNTQRTHTTHTHTRTTNNRVSCVTVSFFIFFHQSTGGHFVFLWLAGQLWTHYTSTRNEKLEQKCEHFQTWQSQWCSSSAGSLRMVVGSGMFQ